MTALAATFPAGDPAARTPGVASAHASLDELELGRMMRLLADRGDVRTIAEHEVISVRVSPADIERHYPGFGATDPATHAAALTRMHAPLVKLGARYGCRYWVRGDLLVIFDNPDAQRDLLDAAHDHPPIAEQPAPALPAGSDRA